MSYPEDRTHEHQYRFCARHEFPAILYQDGSIACMYDYFVGRTAEAHELVKFTPEQVGLADRLRPPSPVKTERPSVLVATVYSPTVTAGETVMLARAGHWVQFAGAEGMYELDWMELEAEHYEVREGGPSAVCVSVGFSMNLISSLSLTAARHNPQRDLRGLVMLEQELMGGVMAFRLGYWLDSLSEVQDS